MLVWFFISSGLFLGASFGSNDAGSMLGSAVASKMLKFKTAALIAGTCFILGAVFQGDGTTKTLNNLASTDTLPAAFTVALSVAVSVAMMTKLKFPVSTSQAVVGALVGWNFFSGRAVHIGLVLRIASSWVLSPVLAGLFAALIFKILKRLMSKTRLNLLQADMSLRLCLILSVAFLAYLLGANNIANFMGLFTPARPFPDLHILNISMSSQQQLFFLGGLAVLIGIYFYGGRLTNRVSNELYRMTPLAGLAAAISCCLVLFLFSSEHLESLLLGMGLPSIPLVPVSATQANIGAVLGIGIAKNAEAVNWHLLAKIGSGWVFTPLISLLVAFVLLFFVQNVFEQKLFADMISYLLF